VTTLIITNDFPPRAGGIQTFVFEMAQRFPLGKVVVLASHFEGDTEFDSTLCYPVVRAKTSVLKPSKYTLELAREIIASHNVSKVVFGAAAPLGLLAPAVRALGINDIVAITHGHEAGWAMTPVTRQLLRRIGDAVDHVTYLGHYTHSKISPALSSRAQASMRQLTPGVDTEVFHPRNRDAAQVLRHQLHLADRPVIVCVSRLMKRKGQDALIDAMPEILRAIPDAALVIVGSGAYEQALRKQAKSSTARENIYFTGKVSIEQLPLWYAVGTIFAMPCRTRNAGWDVEGLGIVFLEASATGLPVIAGNSGGAPDAVIDGATGCIVDGRNTTDISHQVIALLKDEQLRERQGQAGRDWVVAQWTWEHSSRTLQSLLTKD